MPRKKERDNSILEALERLSQQVYILTSSYGKRANGCTVVWVARASFRPPMIAVFVHPKRFTYELLINSGAFCLNVVGKDGLELAKKMGSVSGRESDKFQGLKWRTVQSGAPVLEEGIIGFIDCKLQATFPAGDHSCLLGKVLEAQILSKEKPLNYDPTYFYGDIQ